MTGVQTCALPIFPLIVVNCIILGRAEAFAYRHGVLRSTADGLGMGAGYTVVLVMMGVVQGVSPSLEEASQTLRAHNWSTFRTITWPLMGPGIANSFLLGFVESMADFGNPVVLGGNFDVLSTKIFFAVVGAVHDQGRAAVLSLVLLAFTLGAFYEIGRAHV